MTEPKVEDRVLAIPPKDYKGTVSEWFMALTQRGYDVEKYHELYIPAETWWEILGECEKK